jgi:3-deoxy-D-manno-octulosonic-acid transferase
MPAAGVKTIVINGRISARSFPRYRLIRPFFKRVLADIDRFCVQGEETAGRLAALGAERSRLTITGSLKFDALDATPLPGRGPARVLRFFRMSPNRPVLIAGSTMRGEDEAVIRAFNRVRTTPGGANALLVIAARHRNGSTKWSGCANRKDWPRFAAASCRLTPNREPTP